MARELALVPKNKYEHLLKLVKGNEEIKQSGGRQDENANENTPSNSNIESKDSISDGKTSYGLEDNITDKKASIPIDSKGETGKGTGEEKPRLYVNRPLSEMPFVRAKFIAPRGKLSHRSQRKEKHRKGEKGANSRWINYII